MYALKQFVNSLASPLTLALVLALFAFLCRRLSRPRLGSALLGAAALIAWLGSTPLVGVLLLAPLEAQFPPVKPADLAGVSSIVVLGSSYQPGKETPLTSAFDDEGLRRVVEGVRLQHQLSGAVLTLSGGAPSAREAPAIGGALLAHELGVDDRFIRTLPNALDTREEARDIARSLARQRFVVVTTAAHMPRAMAYLRRAGADPVAAATGYRAAAIRFHWRLLLPSANGLRMTEMALHEYLGLLAQRMD